MTARRRPLGLLVALPLLLGGCLLPQPDTPPIPPMSQATSGKAGAPRTVPSTSPSAASANGAGLAEDANRTAASAAPVATTAPMQPGFDAGGTTTAMAPASPGGTAPTMGATKTLPGRLAVTFTGDDVTEVWLEPAEGGPGAGMPVADDAFTVDLPAGEYVLVLTVDGKRLRATKPIAVPAGGERTLAVEVAGGSITIEESVPLVGPSEAPSTAPSADPGGAS